MLVALQGFEPVGDLAHRESVEPFVVDDRQGGADDGVACQRRSTRGRAYLAPPRGHGGGSGPSATSVLIGDGLTLDAVPVATNHMNIVLDMTDVR